MKQHYLACSFIAMAAACRSTQPHLPAETALSAAPEQPAPNSAVAPSFLWTGKFALGGAQYPALLTLLPTGKSSEGTDTYRAHFKFFLGVLGGHEYISSYASSIVGDAVSGLTVGAAPAEQRGPAIKALHLLQSTLNLDVAWEGDLGRAIFVPSERGQEILADISGEASPLAGTYRGQCGGTLAEIQLETTRWLEASSASSASAFFPYKIQGRMGRGGAARCRDAATLCVTDVFKSGEFQVSSGTLRLKGAESDLECKKRAHRLTCGDCDLQRQERELFEPEMNGPALANADLENKMAQGTGDDYPEFYGWLALGRSGQRERGHRVAFARSASAPVAAEASEPFVLTLRFGDDASYESVIHRLAGAAPSRILEGASDVYLYRLSDSYLLLSKDAGLLGEFRTTGPAMGQPKLTGIYENETWRLTILSDAHLAEAGEEVWPLQVVGWAQEKIPTANKKAIVGAHFDPTSGLISAELEDGRFMMGRQTGDGLELLFPALPTVGSALEPQATAQFTRQSAVPDVARSVLRGRTETKK